MENQLNLITAKQLLGFITERIQVFCFLINFQAFKTPVFYNPSFFAQFLQNFIYSKQKEASNMDLFQTLLKLIKMATHELITKPEIVQLHLTDTAVRLLVLRVTSEHYEQPKNLL